MVDYKKQIICTLQQQGGEPMRQKKLRQAVIGGITDMSEEQLKEGFAEALEELSSEEQNLIFVIDGKVSLVQDMTAAAKTTPADAAPVDADVAGEDTALRESIMATLAELGGGPIRLKKLRQTVMNNAMGDSDETAFKASFADAFSLLCSDGSVSEESGMVTQLKEISSFKKRKLGASGGTDGPASKRHAVTPEAGVEESGTMELWRDGEKAWKDGTLNYEYLCSNPDKITRVFCGNLNLKITEEDLKGAISGITFIKWMTDKQTRKFYGSTFLEMKDPKAAADAVALDKTKLLGRPLKIYYCPPRPGDVWPPVNDGRGPNTKPESRIQEKPEGCRKLFMGNLAYEIDDETIVEFFKPAGALTGLRWLTRKETGEFRGCGYCEFGTTEEADKAIKFNGVELLGRPIRLDWDAA